MTPSDNVGRFSSRLRTALYLTLWSVFSLVLALLFLEILLQSSDILYKKFYYHVYEPPMFAATEWLPFTLRPDVNDVHVRRGEFNVTIRTNTLGLREDREIAIPKPASTFRIVTLGDSFAFGFGADRDKCFQARLEDLLRNRYPDRNIEVIDMGYASAYSPDAAYVYLTREAFKYEPDLILHVFCYSNDIGNVLENLPFSEYDQTGLPVRVQYSPVAIDENGQRTERIEWENRRSWAIVRPEEYPAAERPAFELKRLYSVIKRYIELQEIRSGHSGLLAEDYFRIPGAPMRLGDLYLNSCLGKDQPTDELVTGSWKQGWDIVSRIYRGMNAFSRSNHTPFGVILVPENFLVDYNPDEGERSKYSRWYNQEDMKEAIRLMKPRVIFGKFFDKEGIPFFDPAPGMRENHTEDLYFEFDAHWNDAGHQRLAILMEQWIVESGWLTK